MLKFDDANEILMQEFEAMKVAFDNDEDGYDSETSHCFYEDAFVPYIVKHLNEGNEGELIKIFAFIEKLFREGDGDNADGIINLAAVSVVEPVYYEPDFEKHRDKIYSLCGDLTRKSFEGMEAET